MLKSHVFVVIQCPFFQRWISPSIISSLRWNTNFWIWITNPWETSPWWATYSIHCYQIVKCPSPLVICIAPLGLLCSSLQCFTYSFAFIWTFFRFHQGKSQNCFNKYYKKSLISTQQEVSANFLEKKIKETAAASSSDLSSLQLRPISPGYPEIMDTQDTDGRVDSVSSAFQYPKKLWKNVSFQVESASWLEQVGFLRPTPLRSKLKEFRIRLSRRADFASFFSEEKAVYLVCVCVWWSFCCGEASLLLCQNFFSFVFADYSCNWIQSWTRERSLSSQCSSGVCKRWVSGRSRTSSFHGMANPVPRRQGMTFLPASCCRENCPQEIMLVRTNPWVWTISCVMFSGYPYLESIVFLVKAKQNTRAFRSPKQHFSWPFQKVSSLFPDLTRRSFSVIRRQIFAVFFRNFEELPQLVHGRHAQFQRHWRKPQRRVPDHKGAAHDLRFRRRKSPSSSRAVIKYTLQEICEAQWKLRFSGDSNFLETMFSRVWAKEFFCWNSILIRSQKKIPHSIVKT